MNNGSTLVANLEDRRAKDPDQSFSYHSRVSERHKFICMTVPKVACSRIKSTLHLFEGHKIPEDLGDIHDLGERLGAFASGQLARWFGDPDWFKFCFVRNPYDRLISAYNFQIGNTWNDACEGIIQEIKETFAYPAPLKGQTQLVSFRDFVLYLSDAPDAVRRDGHFNLQTRVLMSDLIAYDFVGRFEQFQADFEQALEALGAAREIIATAAQVLNPTYKVQPALVYDKDLADRAYQMYQPDFETYGYGRDSWMVARE